MATAGIESRLFEASDLVNSSSQKLRIEGLTALKNCFTESSVHSEIAHIKDGGFHGILESIFKLAISEKHSYLSAKTTAGKSRSESNLLSCAETLRTVARYGISRFKVRTVRALLEHVTQLLSMPNGGYCAVLNSSYTRVLVTVLDHPPHIEHMSQVDWLSMTDFCLQGIRTYIQQIQAEPISQMSSARYHGLYASSASGSVSRKSSDDAATDRNLGDPITRASIEDLMECLRFLVDASNAPLLERADAILNVTTALLKVLGSLNQTHKVAFSIINRLFSACFLDRLSLLCQTSREVIPLVQQLWSSNHRRNDDMLDSVRDQMLICVFSTTVHLKALLSSRATGPVREDMRRLRDVMCDTYIGKQRKDLLQLSDLDLSNNDLGTKSSLPLSFVPMLLQHGVSRTAERNWAILHIISVLDDLLSVDNMLVAAEAGSVDAIANDGPRIPQVNKRRRLDNPLYDTMLPIRKRDPDEKIAAIQIVFATIVNISSSATLCSCIELLSESLDETQHDVISWALLGLSIATASDLSADESLCGFWQRLWQRVIRLVTAPSTCTASCYLLLCLLSHNRVTYNHISNTIDAMFTVSALGVPAVISDASIQLMTLLLKNRNVETFSGSLLASESMLRWIGHRWEWGTTNLELRTAVEVSPINLINALRTAVGLRILRLPLPDFARAGLFGEAWFQLARQEGIVSYLLHSESKTDVNNDETSPLRGKGDGSNYSDKNDELASDGIILSHVAHSVLPKLKIMLDTWQARLTNGSHDMTAGLFGELVCDGIFSCMISQEFAAVDETTSKAMDHTTAAIIEMIIVVLEQRQDTAFYRTLLFHVAPFLPRTSKQQLADLRRNNAPFFSFLVRLGDVCTPSSTTCQLSSVDNLADLSHSPIRRGEFRRTSRRVASSVVDPSTFLASASASLRLISAAGKDMTTCEDLPSQLECFLGECDIEDFLAAKNAVTQFLQPDIPLKPTDITVILTRIGELCAAPEYDCCETVLEFCLDILSSMVKSWNDVANEQVSGDFADLYEWFINVVLPQRRPSAVVQIGLAKLMYELVDNRVLLEALRGFPSARSILLDLLQSGSLDVQFNIGVRLSELFIHYKFEQHTQILEDVLDSLPLDPTWSEGIAFRLYVLGTLGSRLPTLLRPCTYYILEVSANVPAALRHAQQCTTRLACITNLENSKEVFRLFAPQLLYTWLEGETYHTLPYKVFGYGSLKDLVQESLEELVALLIMRNQDNEIESIAVLLGTDTGAVYERAFAKIIAYITAHDISVPQANHSPERSSSEVRLRKRLGKDGFSQKMKLHFADIIAHLLTIIDPDGNERKDLVRLSFQLAFRILKDMDELTSRSVTLPPLQQPVFRRKYLMDEIEHVCNRIGVDITDVFSATMVVYLARRLLDSIVPALGSLHACLVLRRMRVLIAVSGSACNHGYPLRMILTSVTSYITNPFCTDDALCIIRYLLTSSTTQLSKTPAVEMSAILAILAALQQISQKTQQASPSDSQLKAVLVSVKSFQEWLIGHLHEFQSSFFGTDSDASLHIITYFTDSMQTADRVANPTHGRALLRLLLRNTEGDYTLVDQATRDVITSVLLRDFVIPATFRADLTVPDTMATHFVADIVNLSKSPDISEDFVVWTAKILGRSFIASGSIPANLTEESALTKIQALAARCEGKNQSRSSIFRLLQTMTSSMAGANAGAAERALRMIIDKALRAELSSKVSEIESALSHEVFQSSVWLPFYPPPTDSETPEVYSRNVYAQHHLLEPKWAESLCLDLAQSVESDYMLPALACVISRGDRFCCDAFAFLLHLVLSLQLKNSRTATTPLSTAFNAWLKVENPVARDNLKLIIDGLLYLRTQAFPGETSIAERVQWLEIDHTQAALAAARCHMFQTSLLFVELSFSENTKQSIRRTAATISETITDLLVLISKNVDDPDMFYGIEQQADLRNVLIRAEYESDGAKCLAFRGAHYDSHLRDQDENSEQDQKALVTALDVLNLDGLSYSLLQSHQGGTLPSRTDTTAYSVARKLERWDLPTPEHPATTAAILYKTFQGLANATSQPLLRDAISMGLTSTMAQLLHSDGYSNTVREALQSLATLTELDEIFSVTNSEQFEELLSRFHARSAWMTTGRYDDVREILSCRATSLGILCRRAPVREAINISLGDARLMEVHASLISSKLSRIHMAFQETLKIATYLTKSIEACRRAGLSIEVAVRLETSRALWDQGEMASSIGLLRSIEATSDFESQTIVVARSDVLAKLGLQIAMARLERHDRILDKYLLPALKALRGRVDGAEAGHVFHEFAEFCNDQLNDVDLIQDIDRLKILKDMKESEMRELAKMVKSASTTETKGRYHSAWKKAQQWFNLDDEEYMRQIVIKNSLLRKSLENYLLSMAASDEHETDALRFFALWQEHVGSQNANEAVGEHLSRVPSRKFSLLMSQLASRLLENSSPFQDLLYGLITRICTDHPYHSMHQIWAGSRSRRDIKDETASSRIAATMRLGQQLASTPRTATVWNAISSSSRAYCQLAGEKDGTRYKTGQRIPLKNSTASLALNSVFLRHSVPPPTMLIELAADLDYSKLPLSRKLDSHITIASGVSAPKIITVLASNGLKFKQLVKGGSDDLRQDAIMEQVFTQVSALLKTDTSTRQRDLGIRTYKVLPLSPNAGVIEFVSNTIPLHEYLMPAHARYYPKDLSSTQCRKQIGDVMTQKLEVRVRTYRSVTERFHPVLRYFFMEKFYDPQEWFRKRLAYVRTTAAISVLGHVLGLGDRHGHNILLDEKTGEVVHIDLGVAFEMGRVLPVPELVPFRLTRDIVDGMGITKTEGVYRRCCEFTLEALRKETNSIMAILDVLRYDPLYSWSISPVRLAKLQDAQNANARVKNAGEAINGRERVNEPGEAERALTVVKQKLSKTLSATATINNLINQATDDINLAVLYSGWAAYA